MKHILRNLNERRGVIQTVELTSIIDRKLQISPLTVSSSEAVLTHTSVATAYSRFINRDGGLTKRTKPQCSTTLIVFDVKVCPILWTKSSFFEVCEALTARSRDLIQELKKDEGSKLAFHFLGFVGRTAKKPALF